MDYNAACTESAARNGRFVGRYLAKIGLEQQGGLMRFRSLCTTAVVTVAGLSWCGWTSAQEVTGGGTTTARAMTKAPSAITQAMLDGAATNANNWIHSNGSYEQ